MALSNEIDLTVEQLPQNPIVLTPVDETDYNNLADKPKVNGVTLEGDKTSSELGLASSEQGEKADSAVQPADLSVYRTADDQDIIDATKQDTLVSGTNIKTVNGNSLLGSGNVDIDALPSQTGQNGKFLTTNGTTPSWAEIPTDVDNKSVSLNSNDQIQTVGVIDQNDTTKAIKTWTGKRALFDAIVTKDDDTIYNITDDNVLADFANTSLSNLTNAGKIVGAGLGMPSNTYIDLTLGASDSTYTAPANGYFDLRKRGNAGQFGRMGGRLETGASLGSNEILSLFLPVRKGEVMTLRYSLTGTTYTFRFVYAEGSKSEAN